MGYYDDDYDYEAEAIRRFESGRQEAERRRLLNTGSIFDASEAFGHDPWALNSFLSNTSSK